MDSKKLLILSLPPDYQTFRLHPVYQGEVYSLHILKALNPPCYFKEHVTMHIMGIAILALYTLHSINRGKPRKYGCRSGKRSA